MARPCSLDLRERVVASAGGGRCCQSVAALFHVSVASVVKWRQRARATGSAAAKPMGGRRPYLLESQRDWLLSRIAEKPDLTLQVLAPTLKPGDIVIMDNLGSHKAKIIRNIIRAIGAHLLFLPAYSPDLSPIEQVFAKLKVRALWRNML